MSEHAINVFNAAKKDTDFVKEFSNIANNGMPDTHADMMEKVMFGVAYYGWLIGKFGPANGQKMYLGITE